MLVVVISEGWDVLQATTTQSKAAQKVTKVEYVVVISEGWEVPQATTTQSKAAQKVTKVEYAAVISEGWGVARETVISDPSRHLAHQPLDGVVSFQPAHFTWAICYSAKVLKVPM